MIRENCFVFPEKKFQMFWSHSTFVAIKLLLSVITFNTCQHWIKITPMFTSTWEHGWAMVKALAFHQWVPSAAPSQFSTQPTLIFHSPLQAVYIWQLWLRWSWCLPNNWSLSKRYKKVLLSITVLVLHQISKPQGWALQSVFEYCYGGTEAEVLGVLFRSAGLSCSKVG